jgi:Ser/Thr protein kinase RdoA (MazF antagonist)
VPDALSHLLALYPAPARALAPPTPLGNAGGGSGARLWRFDSGHGPLVARAYPPDGPGPAVLARIHGWIARLADLDFIPVPLATLDGPTLVVLDASCWEVAPWKPGAADASQPPARARLWAAMGGLAAVHQRLAVDSSIGPSPGLLARLAEAEELFASGLSRFEMKIRNRPGDPTRAAALRWVALARDGLPALVARLRREIPAAIPLQPVLRDARPDHFLFEGDRLTGLVDLGAMGIDSPATDLARLLTDWVGPDRAAFAEALDAYAAIRPLDPTEAARIDVFSESAAWLGPARWIRWHYVEGRRFDDPDAVRLGLDRTLGRLLERLRGTP